MVNSTLPPRKVHSYQLVLNGFNGLLAKDTLFGLRPHTKPSAYISLVVMEIGLGVLTAGATQQSGCLPSLSQAAWKDGPSRMPLLAI